MGPFVCSRCETPYEVQEGNFNKDSKKPGRYLKACRACTRAATKRSVEKKPELYKAATRQWVEDNREAVQIRQRDWRRENPEVDANLQRLKKYGISAEDYAALHEAQGGVCRICQQPEVTPNRSGTAPLALAVDHCHSTGKVRGLLCRACNTAIGLLQENPALIRAAAAYVEHHTNTDLESGAGYMSTTDFTGF